jgi:hypothetical protein
LVTVSDHAEGIEESKRILGTELGLERGEAGGGGGLFRGGESSGGGDKGGADDRLHFDYFLFDCFRLLNCEDKVREPVLRSVTTNLQIENAETFKLNTVGYR